MRFLASQQTLPLVLAFLFSLIGLTAAGATDSGRRGLSCANVRCNGVDKECVELRDGPKCLDRVRECVMCTKMMPMCSCKASERCVLHKQTCDACAYAECVPKQPEDDGKLPPLPIIIEPLPIPPNSLPPVPNKKDEEPIMKPSGVLRLPREDTRDQECLMCAQSVPECTMCFPGRETCILVPNRCHYCAWAGCVYTEDGCLTNVPSEDDLCRNCQRQGLECAITQPRNCREPPSVRCVKPNGNEDACKHCGKDEVCVVSIENGKSHKQCRPRSGIYKR